jgi:hypothetical protein
MGRRAWLLAAIFFVATAACASAPREFPRISPNGPFPNRCLLRAVGTKKVFVVLNGRKHPIQNRRMLEALGLNYDDIHEITAEGLTAIPESFTFRTDYAVNRLVPHAMSTMPNRSLVKTPEDPRVYIITVGQRHWIKEPSPFRALGIDLEQVTVITREQMEGIPEGPAF